VPGVPSAEELSAGPAAELAVRLAEAYRPIAELTAQIERLSARVEELERQARKDSSTSSRPPSSDSPYRKKDSDRSLRERGKRRPGKQPGGPGMTMTWWMTRMRRSTARRPMRLPGRLSRATSPVNRNDRPGKAPRSRPGPASHAHRRRAGPAANG